MKHLVKFGEHLKTQLSFREFQELHSNLGITLYRFNRLLKGKDDWYLEEIGRIAQKLGQDPLDLIEKWGLGRKYITLQDMDGILAERGEVLQRIVHAA